jgi:hypothetical protein
MTSVSKLKRQMDSIESYMESKIVETKEYKGEVKIERTGHGMFSGTLCSIPSPKTGKIASNGEYMRLTLPDGNVMWVVMT